MHIYLHTNQVKNHQKQQVMYKYSKDGISVLSVLNARRAKKSVLFLLFDNVGNGCNEYDNRNLILTDNDESPRGWQQNALVQVDRKTRKSRYTAEYYA